MAKGERKVTWLEFAAFAAPSPSEVINQVVAARVIGTRQKSSANASALNTSEATRIALELIFPSL